MYQGDSVADACSKPGVGMPPRPGLFMSHPPRQPTDWMARYVSVPHAIKLAVSVETIKVQREKKLPAHAIQAEHWRRIGVFAIIITKVPNQSVPFILPNKAAVHHLEQSVVEYWNLHIGYPVLQVIDHVINKTAHIQRGSIRLIPSGYHLTLTVLPERTMGGLLIRESEDERKDRAKKHKSANQSPVQERFGRPDQLIGVMDRKALEPTPRPDPPAENPNQPRKSKAAKRAEKKAEKKAEAEELVKLMKAVLSQFSSFEPFLGVEFKAPGLINGKVVREACDKSVSTPITSDSRERSDDRRSRSPPTQRAYFRDFQDEDNTEMDRILTPSDERLLVQIGAYMCLGKFRHGVVFDGIFALLVKYLDLSHEDFSAVMDKVAVGDSMAVSVLEVGSLDRKDFLLTMIGFFLEAFLEKTEADHEGCSAEGLEDLMRLHTRQKDFA